jgi:hypothetical protein
VEPDNEASYTNCLLTTLGKASSGATVTIQPVLGVPALSGFATDAAERDWISGLPFDYPRLDGAKVIAMLLVLAGYRFWHIGGREYILATTLVTPEGERQVRFGIRRERGLPTGSITISRLA